MNRRFCKALLDLGRVSNLPTVWSNVTGAWFIAGGDWNPALPLAALAASLFYYGGMTLNDVLDAAWDERHEKPRPIPLGHISRRTAGWIGSLTLLAGAIGFLALGANPAWVFALVLAILGYNALHKAWAGSIWVMGACRGLLFLTTASVVTPWLAPEVWLWALLLTGYVAGITLAARGEMSGDAQTHEARALLFLPPIIGAVTAFLPFGYLPFQLSAAALFTLWLLLSYRELRRSHRDIGRFVSRLLAAMVFIDALAAGSENVLAGLLCLSLLPLNHLLQRFVAAT